MTTAILKACLGTAPLWGELGARDSLSLNCCCYCCCCCCCCCGGGGEEEEDNNNNNIIIIIIIMIIIIIIIIIIIAFKGAFLSPTRTLYWPGRNRVQITCNTSSAYHVQHVVLPATWYKGAAQLLSLEELKSHLFSLYFIEPLNRWRCGGNRSTRRNPLATSFRKYHILKPEGSSPKRDSNPHSSTGGRLGKQTC